MPNFIFPWGNENDFEILKTKFNSVVTQLSGGDGESYLMKLDNGDGEFQWKKDEWVDNDLSQDNFCIPHGNLANPDRYDILSLKTKYCTYSDRVDFFIELRAEVLLPDTVLGLSGTAGSVTLQLNEDIVKPILKDRSGNVFGHGSLFGDDYTTGHCMISSYVGEVGGEPRLILVVNFLNDSRFPLGVEDELTLFVNGSWRIR